MTHSELARSFTRSTRSRGFQNQATRTARGRNNSPNLFFAERNFASHEEFVTNAERFGFSDRLTVHKGWFDQTVSADRIRRPIGVLRLDGDWYDSTMVVLERLYDKVASGGLIIIDDYYVWPGCSQAVHDFLSSRGSPDVLKSFGRLTAYIRKRPPDYLERRAAQAEIDRRKRWKSARLGLFTDAAQGKDGSSA